MTEIARRSAEVVYTRARKYRGEIPAAHRATLDTRIQWLWNQRFGTVQTVWQTSQEGDVLDHTAATLVLQAILAKDLESIGQLFQRLEGGAILDEEQLERTPPPLRI
jgi:hypothetical protein